MDVPQPGWFADPTDPRRRRWWDGQTWTDRVSENGHERLDPLPPPDPSPLAVETRRRRLPVWAWVVLALLAVALLVLIWPFVVLAALVVLVTGIVGLLTGRRTWMRFGSRRVAIGVTASAAAIILVTGGVTAALPRPVVTSAAQVDTSVAQPAAATSSPRPSAERTSSPTPTPTVVTTEVSVVTAVPFAKSTVEDGGIPLGESRVTTSGVDGESVAVFRVTTSGGVEVQRVLLRESQTRAPVTEVTSVGTYVAPPPPAADAAQSDGCDPNYADACVPIDSDVDCAGGKGNGPSYFDGVARVVGSDIYGLDGDEDGFACNGAR
jgi:hypothetical protein